MIKISLKAAASTVFATALVALALAPAPADAEIYTVELTNGRTFDSRYQPQRADWDDKTILVLTDVGNWIAVPESMVADVTTLTEVQGFGKVISTTTIELGFSPNDAPDPAAAGVDQPRDPVSEALRVLSGGGGSGGGAGLSDYAVQQFVEPGSATGIPASVIGSGLGTPIGGGEPN